MNIIKIKKTLFNIVRQNSCLDNSELYSVLDKCKNIPNVTQQDIIDEYNKACSVHNEKKLKIEQNNIANENVNEFSNKGIYTINDLYKFMNDNFEYGGILIVNNEKVKLPFGPVNGASNSNKLIRYEDEYVFRPIMDMYNKIEPDNQTSEYLTEQFYNNNVDICELKEYQQIINKVGIYVQKNIWKQRSVNEILNDQISNCYESSFLVGEFFKQRGIKYQKYVIGKYDNIFLSHMFITYQLEGKFYYFEHALRDFKGIYEYNTKEEMEQDILIKFIYNDNYEMGKNIDFDNYFLKPIDDLDPKSGFIKYFEYFDTIPSIKVNVKRFKILMGLTDLVFKEILSVGAIYNNDLNIFYEPIILPEKNSFYDIELWKKKVFKILRKNIINAGFYKPDKIKNIYILNSKQGFTKINNIIEIKEKTTRVQLLYNKTIVDNIFTIEDLNTLLSQCDYMKIKEILMFSSLLEGKNDLYEYGCSFATNLCRTCINMISEEPNKNDICNYQDIDLSGKYANKNCVLNNDNFLNQIISFGKALEVVSESIKSVTEKDYHRDFINTFVDYFVYMIDEESFDINKLKNNTSISDSNFVDIFVTKLLTELINKKMNKEIMNVNW